MSWATNNSRIRQHQLSLFTSWKTCHGCGLSSTAESTSDDNNNHKNKKILICRNCKCRAYHNSDCQKIDWTTNGHKRDCKTLSKAIKPLLQLMDSAYESHQEWWQKRGDISATEVAWSDDEWYNNRSRWQQQDYLNAMEGFQNALEPYQRAWNKYHEQQQNRIPAKGPDDADRNSKQNCSYGEQQDYNHALLLAKRLLFCAYCEMDGQQVDSARQRLVQCLSILLLIIPRRQHEEGNIAYYDINEVLDDAWMELMLSYEEDPITRPVAVHVANVAISSGKSCCNWRHPLQRPGFMAPLHLLHTQSLDCFTPTEKHPPWCKVLEENWKSILHEYQNLQNNPKYWTKVGSGERGSGFDDHRVVSGTNWTEYVLFGAGAAHTGDIHDAPTTKQLLRQYVPDAVSLASMGGGEVIFSRLAPQTKIGAHCGPTNLRLTAHLGLVVPTTTSNCKIRVGLNWNSWESGKFLLFDDSFEHEVRNETNEERVVLLIRTWHPAVSTQTDRARWIEDARTAKDNAVDKRYQAPG